MMLKPGSSFDLEDNAPEAPLPPESLKEAGLTLAFISDMILKTVYMRGTIIGRDLAQLLCLPFKVVREGLSVRGTEALVQERIARPTAPARPRPPQRRDGDIVALEEELSAHLATAVTIAHRKGGAGRLTIDYSSLDQLDGLLARLKA